MSSFFSKLGRGGASSGAPSDSSPSSSAAPDQDTFHAEQMNLWSVALTEFAYDKAKDLMDKYRDGSRGTSWSGFYGLLSQFCLSEKSYIEFNFLQPKGLFRRDNFVKSSYDTFHNDLQKMRMSSTVSGILKLFVVQIQTLVLCRIKMIEFYGHMHLKATSDPPRAFDFKEFENMATEIVGILNAATFHQSIMAIQELWFIEIDYIRRLMQVLDHFNQGLVGEAGNYILHLKNSHDRWDLLIKKAHEEKKKHSFSAALFGSQPEPYVFQWLKRFRSEVQSKYYLYFHKEMSQLKSNVERRKSLLIDHVSRIEAFQRKSEALSVCVLFNGSSIDKFPGIALHLPFSEKPQLSGLDLYQAVYACPAEEEPKDLWPALIMILNQNNQELKEFANTVYFFDPKLSRSFFLLQIDPLMTLIVFYEGQKASNDTLTNSFMQETVSHLRMQPVLASLKPRK